MRGEKERGGNDHQPLSSAVLADHIIDILNTEPLRIIRVANQSKHLCISPRQQRQTNISYSHRGNIDKYHHHTKAKEMKH